MKKQWIYFSLSLLMGGKSFAVEGLGEISTQALFKKETWSQLKPKIVDQLNNNGPEFKQALRFNGLKIKKLDMSNMPLNDLTFKGIKIKKKGETKTKRGKIKKCIFKGSDFTDTVFEKYNFENINFSGMDLKNAKFIKCKFINCNFEGSDLRQVIFEDSIFKEKYRANTLDRFRRLHGALLYDNLVFDSNKAQEELLYDYSNWMKKSKELRELNPELADRYYNKTIGLNKVLGCLCLELIDKNLSNLDLSEINLSNASLSVVNLSNTNLTNAILKNTISYQCNLKNAILLNVKLTNTILNEACLEGAIFSETLQFTRDLDIYNEANMTKEDKNIYRNLFHNQYCFYFHLDGLENHEWNHKDLSNATLNRLDLVGKDLSYFNLRKSILPKDLQGTNFTGANLRKICLHNHELTNAILTGAKLEKSQLKGAALSGAYLSNNVRVPEYLQEDCSPLLDKLLNGTDEEKILYQKFLNLGVNFTKGVPKSELAKLIQQVKNFKNTNLLNMDLGSLNLSRKIFKKSMLSNTILSGTNLKKANLKKTFLHRIQLNGANLRKANLKRAFMCRANLRKADLRGAKLQGVNLSGALLSDQYRLPSGCTDDTLINCYKNCKDSDAQWMLTQILVGKKLLPKSLLEIKEEPVTEEPPAKKIKIE